VGKVRVLADKLKALDFEAMCAEAVAENEEHAADLNTQQLWQGERADGSSMPDYSWVSVNYFNKPEGPIRLFDTGDFYKGFIFATKSSKIEFPIYITSTDSKTGDLSQRYGSEIFGFNQENMAGFAKVFVLPSLGKKLRDYLGLR
jgi:hypothetical protein